MDWFLYDNGLRHERVKAAHFDAKIRIALLYIYHRIERAYSQLLKTTGSDLKIAMTDQRLKNVRRSSLRIDKVIVTKF